MFGEWWCQYCISWPKRFCYFIWQEPGLSAFAELPSSSLWQFVSVAGSRANGSKGFFLTKSAYSSSLFYPLVLYLFSCDKSRSLCNCWAAILFSPTSTSPLWGFRQFVSVAEFFFPLWCGLVALLNNLHMVFCFISQKFWLIKNVGYITNTHKKRKRFGIYILLTTVWSRGAVETRRITRAVRRWNAYVSQEQSGAAAVKVVAREYFL